MKKVLLSLAAVTAIAAAATPAAADHNDRYDRGYGYGYQVNAIRQINERQALIAQRIDRAIHRGEINRWEARSLIEELRVFERVEHQYRRGGLSRSEFAVLDRRLDHLQNGLRRALNGRSRDYGYGYGQRW
jgi:hypothetical protein